MGVLAKGTFLTFALITSFACMLWIAIILYVIFTSPGVHPHIVFLLPIVVFGGAAVVGFKFYYDERRGSPTFATGRLSDSPQNGLLLTTRLSTGIAVCLTAFVLFLAIRDVLHPNANQEALAPFSFMLHGAALATVNVIFWGYVAWLGFCFIRGSSERERVVVIGWAVSCLLTPIEQVRPEWVLPLRYLDVLTLLIALLAALSIWVRPLSPAENSQSAN